MKIKVGQFIIGLLLVNFNFVSAQIPVGTQTVIDSFIKVINKSKEDTFKVKAIMDLVNIYIDYDMTKAREYAKYGNELSKKLKYPFGVARTSFSLGSIAGDLGYFKEADSMLNTGLNIFASLNMPEKVAGVKNQMGGLQYMQGNYWLAGDYYAEAANVFEKMNDTVKYLVAFNNLVAVMSETENFSKAIAIGEKILPIAKLTKDSLQVFYIMQGLLVSCTKAGKLNNAAMYLPELLKATKSTSFYLAGDIYSAAGDYYSKIGNLDSSLHCFFSALEIAKKIGVSFQIANHLSSIGFVYKKMGNKAQAKTYFNKALALADSIQHSRAVYEVSKSLSDLYSNEGNTEMALPLLQRHLVLKDSIRNANISNHINYLEAKYEDGKKSKQINELELKNTQSKLVLAKRNQLVWGFGIGSIALLLLFASFYRNSRQRKAKADLERKIQQERIVFLEQQQQVVSLQAMVNGQETERTRIAKDLHDGLGGLFSTVKMYFSTLEHEQPALQQNELFRKSYDMVNTSATELRRIAHNMMPDVLMKMGLNAALKDLCSSISIGGLLQVSLLINGMNERLNASTEIMLYRILQELLSNIIKHAQASEVIVQFIQDGERLSVTVEDNGRGFNTAETELGKTAGMESIKSRVNYLKGKLAIESEQGLGTTVMMDFLINQE